MRRIWQITTSTLNFINNNVPAETQSHKFIDSFTKFLKPDFDLSVQKLNPTL